jgi:hypothetical protein
MTRASLGRVCSNFWMCRAQEWSTLDMPQTQNPSLPETALRLMRRINRLPLPDRTVLRISEAVEARRSWFAAR